MSCSFFPRAFETADDGVSVSATPAIAAKGLQRDVVALLGDGRGRASDTQVTRIAAVGRRRATVMSTHWSVSTPTTTRIADAEVLQEIVDIGRVEDAGRGPSAP